MIISDPKPKVRINHRYSQKKQKKVFIISCNMGKKLSCVRFECSKIQNKTSPSFKSQHPTKGSSRIVILLTRQEAINEGIFLWERLAAELRGEAGLLEINTISAFHLLSSQALMFRAYPWLHFKILSNICHVYTNMALDTFSLEKR